MTSEGENYMKLHNAYNKYLRSDLSLAPPLLIAVGVELLFSDQIMHIPQQTPQCISWSACSSGLPSAQYLHLYKAGGPLLHPISGRQPEGPQEVTCFFEYRLCESDPVHQEYV